MAIEAISNIRTVVGLQCEKIITDKFTASLSCEFRKWSYTIMVILIWNVLLQSISASASRLKKQSHMRGLLFGFAQATPNYAYGLIMWYGGYLVKNDGLLYKDAFK